MRIFQISQLKLDQTKPNPRVTRHSKGSVQKKSKNMMELSIIGLTPLPPPDFRLDFTSHFIWFVVQLYRLLSNSTDYFPTQQTNV